MQIKTIINNKKLTLLLFAITICLLGIFHYFKDPYFVPDDSMMNYISRGGFSVKPDEHIIFVNVIIGWICKWLYGLTNSINWFAVLFILIMLLCVFVLYTILSRHMNNWLSFILCIFTELFIMRVFTFTALGFVCTTVSIVAIIDILSNYKNKSKKTIILFVMSVVLFCLGLMTRAHSWLGAILISIPIVIIFLKKHFVKEKKIILMIMVGLLALSSLIWLVNYYSYQNEHYSEFSAYNKVRSSVMDYPIPSYSENEQEYKRLGISENDYNCMRDGNEPRYLIGDKKHFNKEKLERIVELSDKYNCNLKKWIEEFLRHKELFITFAVAIFLLFGDVGKRKIYYVVEMLLVYLTTLLLNVTQRGDFRIFVCITFCGVINALYYYYANNNKKHHSRIITALVVIAIIAYMQRCCDGIIQSWNSNMERSQENHSVREYVSNNKDNLYVMPAIKLNYVYYYGSINNMAKEKNTNVLPIFDWYTYLDDYYNKANHYKLKNKDSLLLSMIDSNVYHISSNDSSDKEERIIIKKYIEEHSQNKHVLVRKIERIGKTKFNVYKFVVDRN